MADTLDADLDTHRRQFAANRDEAVRLCRPLTRGQFNWPPAAGRWSVADCLVHLTLSATLFGEAMLAAAARGRAHGITGTGPFRYGVVARWFYRSLAPGRGTYPSPRRLTPPAATAAAHDVSAVLEAFIAAGTTWEACLRAMEGLDLGRIRVLSPVMPLLRLPLGATIAIQVQHEHRHLRQARDVTESPGFPAS